MKKELEGTLNERYKQITLCFDDICKLEKKKLDWRKEQSEVNKEISGGKNSDFFDSSGLGANIMNNQKKVEFIEESINKIKEKQLEKLRKVESIIKI